jgi:ABC-2 type transport system ATP-binding protein
MSDIALQIKGLTKRYGPVLAVNDLSLDIREGEIFGFLGPNGAGKTTSILMMCGLLAPDSGTVTIRGVPVLGRDGVHRQIGMCPQEIVLWERLTCLEQLVFIGQLYGMRGRDARTRSVMLLEELGLSEKRDAQARMLSGGMQRRLNLAMALVHDPEIVILDEPEAGLDPQSRVRVREYIQSLARRKTVVLTTHNMDEAERVADRVAIIDHGELLRVGALDELLQTAGSGGVVEIHLQGDSAGFAKAALIAQSVFGAGATTFLEGDVLTVRALHSVALLPTLLESLQSAGLRPGELSIRENTLEDVFLQLTGRRLRA